MIIYLSLLVAIIGAVLFVVGDKYPKMVELGRLSFVVGLLAFLLNSVQRFTVVH